MRGGRRPGSVTIVIGLEPWPPGKSRSTVSATVRALWPFGITEESTGVQTARSAGSASTSISAPVPSAIGQRAPHHAVRQPVPAARSARAA